jgi:hypothetical protein
MAVPSPFTEPLLFISQLVLAALTIKYTSNASILRPITIGALLALLNLEIRTARSGPNKGALASYAFLITTHLANILCINTIDSEQLKSASPTNSSGFLSALFLTFNVRGIRTPWQARNVPPFPDFYPKVHAPRRGVFLLRQAAICTWMYVSLDFYKSISSPYLEDEYWKERLFPIGAEHVYLDATPEQWFIRVAYPILFFAVSRIGIDVPQRFLSIVLVGIGIYSPSDFPPLFGSVWDAYSIRKFWG